MSCFDLLSRDQHRKQKSCLRQRVGVSFSWMVRAQSFGPSASCCLLHPCSISEHTASCSSYVFWNPAQGSIWMKTPHKTRRWKSYTAYNVFIFRHPSNKASEERQLSGMTKEMNREESMKLSLRNMGWSCVLPESNQLGYSFNFILSPSFTFLSKEKKTANFQPMKKHLIFLYQKSHHCHAILWQPCIFCRVFEVICPPENPIAKCLVKYISIVIFRKAISTHNAFILSKTLICQH